MDISVFDFNNKEKVFYLITKYSRDEWLFRGDPFRSTTNGGAISICPTTKYVWCYSIISDIDDIELLREATSEEYYIFRKYIW